MDEGSTEQAKEAELRAESGQEEGLTFGEIFRMVKKHLWIVLLSCVAFTVACVLLLALLINPMMTSYSISFRIIFPTQDQAIYPDGSPFFYQDIVSKNYLLELKNIPDFADVDVDRMVRENGASVTVAKTEEGVSVAEGPYTLTFEGSYFDGSEQANSFLHQLANHTREQIQKNHNEEVSYALDENTFNKASFDERISLLDRQRDTLLSQYEFWIENYSEAYRVTIGDKKNTLGDLRTEVAILFGQGIRSGLESEIETRGYAFVGEGAAYESFTAYKESLIREYQLNKLELEALQSVINGGKEGTLPERATELIARNTRIQQWLGLDENGKELEAGNPTLTEKTNEAFAKRLTAEYDKVKAASDKLTEALGSIYQQGTQVLFEEQTVEASGGVSAWLGGALALIGSFAIACVIVCSVENSRRRANARNK